MAESTFNLTYEGPALRDGRMDVRTLVPALLGMDELIRVTNARLGLALDDCPWKSATSAGARSPSTW